MLLLQAKLKMNFMIWSNFFHVNFIFAFKVFCNNAKQINI